MDNKPRESGIKDEEAALKALIQRKKIPEVVRKFFGEKYLNKLVEIIENPLLVDIDILYMTGECSLEELYEYLAFFPEFLELERSILSLGEEIMSQPEVQKKINYHLGRLFQGSSLNYEKGFYPIIQLLREIYITQKVPAETRSNRLLTGFLGNLLHRICMHTLQLVKNDYPQKEDLVVRLFQFLKTLHGNDDPFLNPASFINNLDVTARVLITYGREFSEILKGNLAQHEKDLSSDASVKFAEISLLSLSRTISFESVVSQSFSCRFSSIGTDTDSHINPTLIAGVTLSFHQKKDSILMENGKLSFTSIPNEVPLNIARCSGDLLIPNTDISLLHFMDVKVYLCVKNAIYDILLEYLRKKKEDIVLSNRKTDHRELDMISSDIRSSFSSWKPDKEIAPPLPELTPSEPFDPAERLPLPRSLKGEEVFRALRSLLGEPIRVQGSHHVFKGRNEKKYPVPIHFGQDVNPYILKKGLQHFGIPISEFLAAI